DGPSAGITMAAALISALTGNPIKNGIAMTGEITLRGRVLPIGGLKEKSLAALRAKTKTIIIPERNEKDLVEIPEDVRERLTFIPVRHMDDVVEAIFRKKSRTKPKAAPKPVTARRRKEARA
ncbi:MAG: S16 family serine protease, partial [Thermodesulfobacteriota bacterium]